MPGNGRIGIAQRLERSDLLALRGHQAREHHMQQKSRHGQKDGGQQGAHHALLLDLVVEHGVRCLVLAAAGVATAIGRQQARQAIEHGGL